MSEYGGSQEVIGVRGAIEAVVAIGVVVALAAASWRLARARSRWSTRSLAEDLLERMERDRSSASSPPVPGSRAAPGTGAGEGGERG